MLIVAPTVEPVTRTQAKAHLRVTDTGEDDLIDALIAAARVEVETFTRQALVKQTHLLKLDYFPACIHLPVHPLCAVSSITYIDSAGATQTVDAADYRVDAYSMPARITPAYGKVWPSTQDVTGAVSVNYTAGLLLPFTADASADTLTSAGHGLVDANAAQIMVNGTVPTGLAAATTYYVRDAAADTLKLAATSGGAAIDITGAGVAPNFLCRDPGKARVMMSALYLILGHLFERRQQSSELPLVEIPLNAYNLLTPHRVVRF